MEAKIIIGSDHGGYELKETLKQILEDLSYEVEDVGCHEPTSVDYPAIAKLVTEPIAAERYERGILICGTGIGMSIAANRSPGIRATLCHDHFTAKMAKEHNNSNILVLGARVLGIEIAKDILETWLNTEFEGGRHQKRVEMFDL